MNKKPAYLIVNADDYGYFTCISRGILDGGKNGLITATGVIANSSHFNEHIQWLKTASCLDAGVHLNLSHGEPLTGRFGRKLRAGKGKFPVKYSLLLGLMARTLTSDDVLEEWHAQIRRCIDAGLKIYFLNTHEHLHAFPTLFKIVLRLKKEYNIPFFRFPEPEWDVRGGFGGIVRNTLLHCIVVKRAGLPEGATRLLGMSCSGKLSMGYLRKRLASLENGKIYELMCHPGSFDADEIRDRRLTSYHDWQGELDLLKSREVRDLCDSMGIRITGYSGLAGEVRT